MATVPQKCEGCGVQCELVNQLSGMIMAKEMAEEHAGIFLGEDGEKFDAIVDMVAPEDVTNDIKREVRQLAGSKIEEIDRMIEGVQQEIKANKLACDGVFKMRATKGDVTYTASICTSPKQYVRDGEPSHLSAFIKASSANKSLNSTLHF